MLLSDVVLEPVSISVKHLWLDWANKTLCLDVIGYKLLVVSQRSKSVDNNSKHNLSHHHVHNDVECKVSYSWHVISSFCVVRSRSWGVSYTSSHPQTLRESCEEAMEQISASTNSIFGGNKPVPLWIIIYIWEEHKEKDGIDVDDNESQKESHKNLSEVHGNWSHNIVKSLNSRNQIKKMERIVNRGKEYSKERANYVTRKVFKLTLWDDNQNQCYHVFKPNSKITKLSLSIFVKFFSFGSFVL